MKLYNFRPGRNRTLSLVEITIVLALFGIIMASAFSMFMAGYQSSFRTQARLEVNTYVRKATDQLTFKGRQASYFLLYDRFDGSTAIIPPATVPSFGDFRSPSRQGADGLPAGETGSCLVFVFNGENPTPLDPDSITPIRRLVVYTLDTNAVTPDKPFRLREYDLILDPADPRCNEPVETLIPAAITGPEPAANLQVCIPWARGLLNGDIFQNLDGKSVVMSAQFYYGNPDDDLGPGMLKSATNTYSFTITPRGTI